MKKENLHKEISGAVRSLVNMARESTFNKISDNCMYILSEIKNSEKNFFEQNKIRKIENNKKTPKHFADIIKDLENLYADLYDVNLYIYKTNKNSTIIEIQYFTRSSLNIQYQKISDPKETMLHCKIPLPPYVSTNKEKFDINWQLGTLNHKWKMFWWQQKANKIIMQRVFRVKANRIDYPQLIELLDKAEILAREFKGGYSGEFLSAEEFHQALLESINKFKNGDKTQLEKLHLWFLPTSCWDDFVGSDGQDLANEISPMLSKLTKVK